MVKTILAIDDSSSIRQLLSSTLSRAGFSVLVADDGADGMAQLAENAVDLIITDLHMPVMDGIDLICSVRRHPVHRFLPIIMLTTEQQFAMKQAGATAGATAWLTKPFKPEELLAVIRRVLP